MSITTIVFLVTRFVALETIDVVLLLTFGYRKGVRYEVVVGWFECNVVMGKKYQITIAGNRREDVTI